LEKKKSSNLEDFTKLLKPQNSKKNPTPGDVRLPKLIAFFGPKFSQISTCGRGSVQIHCESNGPNSPDFNNRV